MDGFEAALAARARAVEAALEALIPAPERPAAELFRAMRYASLGGGKRLRGFLALESAALMGAPEPGALRAAASVECLHAYSLIHDDLPCMDDDAMRRGRPSTHKAFGEAMAVLAGDALQSLAFEILAAPRTCDDAAIRAALTLGLARAAGGFGMVGGQVMDMAAETAGAALDQPEIEKLQSLKTGALIRFAAASGAILAGRDPAPLERYASALGLAFQIRDDLLDVEGDEQAAGKRLRKDQSAGKATFVALLGADGARARAEALVQEAREALAPYGPAAARLRDAAEFSVRRGR